MVSRSRTGIVASWWWTVDKVMLSLVVALMLAGMVFSLTASPSMAARLEYAEMHFVIRHAVFLAMALVGMIGVSLLPSRRARQLAVLVLVGSFALMVVTLLVDDATKGAARWIPLGPFKIQPSEFMKPGLVVFCAWAFAEDVRRRDVPGLWLACATWGVAIGLLMLQPDFGQSVLVTLVWGTLLFMAGIPMWFVGLGIGAALLLGAGAYLAFGHVASRIDRFVFGEGDTFQVDRAHDAITRGGWLGQGPGEGVVKHRLPDSHTDFIFSAMTEEFGILVALALMALFAAVTLRGIWLAMRENEPFLRFAVTGLTMVFGLQAVINMGVNVQVFPAKGMTLPFISYGGSSMLSMALTMGLLLAFTRKRAANYANVSRTNVPVTALASAA